MTPYNGPRWQGGDDQRLNIIRRDLSGGQNTRVQANSIKETQAVGMSNMDITVPGQRKKRPGSVLIGNDIGAVQFEALFNYVIQGATDQLIGYTGSSIRAWSGSGNWAAGYKTNFTASQTDVGIIGAKESGNTPDDIVVVSNGTDNVFRFLPAGTAADLGDTNTSPPKTTVMAWYANRIWSLKNDLFYYSDAYASDYSAAFDRTTNSFRIPVGEERGIVPTRDLGMVVMGDEAIWALNPTSTPAATDKPVPLVTFVGCVSKNGWAMVGDDVYFFAQDGLRELKRTVQDKLQTGDSFPVSYALKEEFEAISWAHIANLSMKYYDNKLFISVPTGAATFSTWVYYPSYNAFTVIDGWSPTCMETYKVSGEQRFYYGAQGDGVVYRGWYGRTDEGTTTTNGTAVTMIETGREEDFGQPLTRKVGGEVEIEASTVGDDNSLTVEARTDGGSWSTLGSVALQSTDAPTLPVALPFTLSDNFLIRDKLHLDSLGPFRTIQFRITNADSNTEDVNIYGVNSITFPEQYENEQRGKT